MPNFDPGRGNPQEPLSAWERERWFASISHLQVFYPEFGSWFWAKVIPGLESGTRLILPSYAGDRLAAVAILKRVPEERKICTLWVAPFARGIGLGGRLLSGSLSWLDCEKPLITVCQERLRELRPLLRKFGFTLEQVCDSCYRAGRLEYVFNGLIRQSQTAFDKSNFATLNLTERASTTVSLPPGCCHL
jgi:GNAT superfamily N-acetyltransferase